MAPSPTTASPVPGSDPDDELALTVVVPACNEVGRLAAGVARFRTAVDDGAVNPDTTELVVVDDGSTDGTSAVATELLSFLPHHRVVRLERNQGKGAAVRSGVAVARGRAVAYMDADFSIDPHVVPDLLTALETHDVAIGSRALPRSMVESTYVVRSVTGQLFNALVTLGTGLRLRDTQCGCKAFRTPVARLLFQLGSIDRFAFDVELLTTARRLGLRIGEVPVHWKHVPGSTVHPFHDSLPMLRDVYRARLGWVTERVVPALVVELGADHGCGPRLRAAVHSLPLVGPPPPVVEGPSGSVVLLPLVEPDRVAACADVLTAALAGVGAPEVRITRRVLPLTALRALGPLGGRVGEPPTGVGPG